MLLVEGTIFDVKLHNAVKILKTELQILKILVKFAFSIVDIPKTKLKLILLIFPVLLHFRSNFHFFRLDRLFLVNGNVQKSKFLSYTKFTQSIYPKVTKNREKIKIIFLANFCPKLSEIPYNFTTLHWLGQLGYHSIEHYSAVNQSV